MPDTLSEKIYYKAPVFVQNSIFTLQGWKLARKRYNPFFYKYLEQLKRMQWWSDEQIKLYQDKNIMMIVRHAYDTVPFYRQLYDDNGVDVSRIKSTSDLKHLPVVTKKMVKEKNHDMISSAFKKGSLIKGLTSGTTGAPVTIYQTAESLASQWATWWRHKSRFGLTIMDRHLTFGSKIPVDQSQSRTPYWRSDFLNNRVYLSIYHISKQTVEDIVDYLNSTNFDFFTGWPSIMYVLAALMEESKLRLYNRPKYIVTGSEVLLPAYESLISRVFGVPVTEQYGMAEFAGNMSKCEHGNFHEDFECCFVEGLPIDGSDCHNLILTGWANLCMPFIRYEVGDYGTPLEQCCPCGRESKCFVSIDGRLEDFIVAPDGRKIIGMASVLKHAKNAGQIQIYQNAAGKVEFRIVPAPGFGEDDIETLTREFQKRAGREIEISFKITDKIEKTSSGKLKAVISEVPE
ncbi:MAG: phenylacetate--CoA ligase family protein [Desulfobacteraceae bacterium]|nr:phenylacetate--CoA ligase family protein [Desulfobacteraceae bacterium]